MSLSLFMWWFLLSLFRLCGGFTLHSLVCLLPRLSPFVAVLPALYFWRNYVPSFFCGGPPLLSLFLLLCSLSFLYEGGWHHHRKARESFFWWLSSLVYSCTGSAPCSSPVLAMAVGIVMMLSLDRVLQTHFQFSRLFQPLQRDRNRVQGPVFHHESSTRSVSTDVGSQTRLRSQRFRHVASALLATALPAPQTLRECSVHLP